MQLRTAIRRGIGFLVLKKRTYITCWLLVNFFAPHPLNAQNCNNDSSYFSIQYKGSIKNNFNNAIITPLDEVVVLGTVGLSGNFVTKFTNQGNILWTNQYSTDYKLVTYSQFPWYTNLVFKKITVGPDSTYLVVGSVTEHGETVNNTEQPPAHQTGVILKIDKFGKIVWGKSVGAWGTEYAIENIEPLANGDLLIYLASYAQTPVNRIIYLDSKGNLKWATPIITEWLGVGGATHAMKQLRNGNIVVADEVYRNRNDTIWPTPFTPIPIPAPLYFFNFFGLDKTTGKIIWDQNYRTPTDTSSIPLSYIPDIKHINQLPDGSLSFFADMYMPVKNAKNYVNRATNVITDSAGLLKYAVIYYESNNPSQLLNAMDAGNNGEQIFVAKDNVNGHTIISQVDKDGQIQWSKAYGNTSSGLPPRFALRNAAGNRYFVLMSDGESPDLQMLITNKSGNIPCAQISSQLIAENTTWPWKLDLLSFLYYDVGIDFGFNGLNMKLTNYSLQANTDCKYQYVCCSDIIDSVNIHQVALCKGTSYTLPDQDATSVTDSGRYYVTYATPNGCDSTVFYDVTLSKNPNDLRLVPDTCFNGQDSLVLHATDSFATYTWMNNFNGSGPDFTVYKPGAYWVNVSNICGSKTDTTQVYDRCNFPVTMANAFTPNADGKNDFFGIPPQNKNHLVRLVIFNRWGEKVFASSNPAVGWDGNFNGRAQPAGTYIYYLMMRGLDGKEINQKGTLVLIR